MWIGGRPAAVLIPLAFQLYTVGTNCPKANGREEQNLRTSHFFHPASLDSISSSTPSPSHR